MSRPYSLRVAMVAAIASASVASCVAPRPTPRPITPPPAAIAPEPEGADSVVESTLKAHNVRRTRAGLPPVSSNPRLTLAAEGHARDMADRRKMSHKGGDGSSPFDRIDRQGYRYRAAGENVAYGLDDVEAVMAAWMRSPGHRRNILGRYTQIGVGRAIAKDGASYWCVTFGTPPDH